MSSGKRDHVRSAQRWSKPERSPASRRGREHWVVRWIGAANNRRSKAAAANAIEPPCAEIIPLSWADTFGRQMRVAPTPLPSRWSRGDASDDRNLAARRPDCVGLAISRRF
jgi:hypothetical protein